MVKSLQSAVHQQTEKEWKEGNFYFFSLLLTFKL